MMTLTSEHGTDPESADCAPLRRARSHRQGASDGQQRVRRAVGSWNSAEVGSFPVDAEKGRRAKPCRPPRSVAENTNGVVKWCAFTVRISAELRANSFAARSKLGAV